MHRKTFEHYILTRFNTMLTEKGLLYDDPERAEDWMQKRMLLFRETKKSVLSQGADFRWIISVDRRTPNDYLLEIMGDDRITIIFDDILYAGNHMGREAPWIITTRLDNDDQLMPGFVKSVQEQFEPKLKVIDVRYYELDWEKQAMHEGVKRWSGSMFISLVEKCNWVATVFSRPHGQLATGYPLEGNWIDGWTKKTPINYEIIEEPLAVMVCHNNNITNKVRGKFLYKL